MTIRRRDFVTTVLATGLATPVAAAQDEHNHTAATGPLAAATVSFGAWPASQDGPLDRFDTPNAPAAPNVHQLFPAASMVKVGGAVNFVIAGFHLISIYGPGTKPEDIDATNTIALPGAPPGFPPAINDLRNLVYRGLNPLPLPQDRVEVVQFKRRGTYLVICSFLPHFEDRMWGYVKVVR
jgi:hypothetical protein